MESIASTALRNATKRNRNIILTVLSKLTPRILCVEAKYSCQNRVGIPASFFLTTFRRGLVDRWTVYLFSMVPRITCASVSTRLRLNSMQSTLWKRCKIGWVFGLQSPPHADDSKLLYSLKDPSWISVVQLQFSFIVLLNYFFPLTLTSQRKEIVV